MGPRSSTGGVHQRASRMPDGSRTGGLGEKRGHSSLQALQEVQQAQVPLLRLVQVTGMSCSFQQEHLVIGEVLEVVQAYFPELGVLVPIHNQRGGLAGGDTRHKSSDSGYGRAARFDHQGQWHKREARAWQLWESVSLPGSITGSGHCFVLPVGLGISPRIELLE